ncbi:ATP-binding cassette domain-containing protein [Bacillus sp. JJ1533]|uniref:ABC transporter ATP-binding protein n=1 Tax=Bacillus sp. JJ1533 TaxID=3122959 RepID=UPI003000A99E
MYKEKTYSDSSVLDVQDMSVFHGKLKATNNVSFNLKNNEVLAIVGPNGAGKTSIMMGLSGTAYVSGNINYMGMSLHRKTNRLQEGIAHVPQGRGIFGDLTVRENLLLGKLGLAKNAETSDIDEVIMFFPVLKERISKLAGTLSGGEQQMLAIARAMISKPTLLLLDEPGMGLAPKLRIEVYERIKKLLEDNQKKMSILICDQEIGYALRIADRVSVLQNGELVFSDSVQNVNIEDISEKYLDVHLK